MTGLVLGGDGGTAWSAQPSHFGFAGDLSALGRDLSFMLGRSRADYIEPPIPDITIGTTSTFVLGFEPDGLPDHRVRYNWVRDRIHYANDSALTTGTAMDGTPWFAENHAREQLLVRCLGGRDLQEVRDVWGLIVGGSDDTSIPGTGATLSVDVFVLARESQYGDYQDVRDDLER